MFYHIENSVLERGAHHQSIKALWETKWRKRAVSQTYPFWEGKMEDFEEIFNELTRKGLCPPYDFDEYAAPFLQVGESLELRATEAEETGDVVNASELFLRTACVYRLGRFPFLLTATQRVAWERQKRSYLKGAGPTILTALKMLPEPVREYLIPYIHGLEGSSETGSHIPVYIRRPKMSSHPNRSPLVMQILGLDNYRTECTPMSTRIVAKGWAYMAVEIPGTGDCPALAVDPESADRLFSSILAWLHHQSWVDKRNIIAWGTSTGGYYSLRLAHTHQAQVTAVIVQGGGCHYMFDPKWLDLTSHLEYAFDLSHFIALKFGYKDVTSMKQNSQQRFSLLENGILDKPAAKTLLINGVLDDVFPIEDSILALQHGPIKEARLIPGLKHLGEPIAGPLIFEWIERIFS